MLIIIPISIDIIILQIPTEIPIEQPTIFANSLSTSIFISIDFLIKLF